MRNQDKISPPILENNLQACMSFFEVMPLIAAAGEVLCGFLFENEGLSGVDLEKIEIKGCKFVNCKFGGADLTKAWLSNNIFERCDFENVHLSDSSVHKCAFINCRLTGIQLFGASLQDVRFKGCTGEYANFTQGSFKSVCFEDSNFKNAVLNDVKIKNIVLQDSDFARADWLHTALKDVDLTLCNIDGCGFSVPQLAGAMVTAQQACELARLLGVKIK